jgi:hypothetical protein
MIVGDSLQSLIGRLSTSDAAYQGEPPALRNQYIMGPFVVQRQNCLPQRRNNNILTELSRLRCLVISQSQTLRILIE